MAASGKSCENGAVESAEDGASKVAPLATHEKRPRDDVEQAAMAESKSNDCCKSDTVSSPDTISPNFGPQQKSMKILIF